MVFIEVNRLKIFEIKGNVISIKVKEKSTPQTERS